MVCRDFRGSESLTFGVRRRPPPRRRPTTAFRAECRGPVAPHWGARRCCAAPARIRRSRVLTARRPAPATTPDHWPPAGGHRRDRGIARTANRPPGPPYATLLIRVFRMSASKFQGARARPDRADDQPTPAARCPWGLAARYPRRRRQDPVGPVLERVPGEGMSFPRAQGSGPEAPLPRRPAPPPAPHTARGSGRSAFRPRGLGGPPGRGHREWPAAQGSAIR